MVGLTVKSLLVVFGVCKQQGLTKEASMLIKTLLNHLHRFKGFVVGRVQFGEGQKTVEIEMKARAKSRPVCSSCGGKNGRLYGRLKKRRYQFVPIWGIATYLVYAPRRVDCPACGVVVEEVPWARGKEQQTQIFQLFLSHWAKKLSWQEVAREFKIGWSTVYRALNSLVEWGIKRRELKGIRAIGIDELMIWSGHRYVTVVYQLDEHCRRLLWVGKERTGESLEGFFKMLGPLRYRHIQYVCSDMWRGYLKVVAKRLPKAIHILDRFHIVANLNKALDQVRSEEAKRLKASGDDETLKKTRWCILKRPKNLTPNQRGRLRELLSYNLRTVRAYLLVQEFNFFWSYNSPTWAGKFLDVWCRTVMRSRIEPLKKMAQQLRGHKQLLLNWFIAKKQFSSGAVEACNNNAKLAIRKAYGFRSFKTLEIALYHKLGKLPEPPLTNKFW